ncbi:MAG: glycosyltransferase family 1 protein [Patescibacteria group bacterium]|nr:MAG: glycosyltransferase family 1 protein [Patescibacteria group bacterium]
MSNRSRRVLIDGRALLDRNGGGVFEYARRLTAALKESGRYAIETWANAALPPKADLVAPVAGIDTLTRYPNKLLNASMRLFKTPHLERFASEPPTLCWMPNPHFVALSPSLPLALTIHDLTFETYPEFFSLKQRLWHRAVAPRNLARRANVVLAVSETTKRDLVDRWRLPPEKIVVTHEGVASDFFDTPPQDALRQARERWRLPERFILHVGALEPRKNHLGLLDAYHQLRPQARYAGLGLVLAGPSGWNNAAILQAIRRSPYRDDIRLLGYVNDLDRRCLYRLASLLAFPSFYEGFGLPPLEAMASGLPVVASHAGALSEIMETAGLLTDPYRPTEIAAAIDAILDSPSLAERYVARGRDRATLFRWSACAEKTEGAFDIIAGT